MWLSMLYNGSREYYMKYINNTFYITNFIHIWEKYYTNIHLSAIIQEENPHLEDDNASLTSQCLQILFGGITNNKAEISIKFQGEQNTDVMLIYIETFDEKLKKIRIRLQLKLSTPSKFYEEVTLSLIQSIKELKDSEKHLFELLKQKDAEIQDYKAEGACLTLKHLETKPFNQQEHQQIYTPSNNSSFSYKDLSNVLNSNVKDESTPKHPIVQKSDTAVSSIKKEMKDQSPIKSTASSPALQIGVAPVFTGNDEDVVKEEPEESILRFGKRKRTIRKQLDL